MSLYNPNSPDRALEAPQLAIPSVNINSVLKLVYVWMGLGLLTTAGVAWMAATNPALEGLRTTSGIWIISLVVLIGTVFGLNYGIHSNKLSPNVAAALFFVFAAVMGFSLSLTFEYFVTFQPGAMAAAFATTAGLFGTMTVVGLTTRADLTKMGTYLFIGLIGLVIAMVVNLFILSSALSFFISVIGVVIFTGLTAYDTQKIKEMSMNPELQGDGNMVLKFSILGALTLYLDFINLFMFLLQLFGMGGND
ncbi:MAG: Bax inhibitor-1/YccA family protein [Phototrophicaceae bacterium]